MQNLFLVMIGGGIAQGRAIWSISACRSWLVSAFLGDGRREYCRLARHGLAGRIAGPSLGRHHGDAAFLATGILGGFTTFSAFSLDFATLWQRGASGVAFAYALLSVIGALAAVFAGLWPRARRWLMLLAAA
jgi:CrcB protein